MSEEKVQALIEKIRPDSWNIWVVMWAADEFAKLGEPAIVPLAERLGAEEDGGIATAIIGGLGKIGMPIVPVIIQRMGNEGEKITIYTVAALEKIGSLALPQLINALEDENEHRRANAAKALGDIKDKKALFPLLKKLKEGDALLRKACAGALLFLRDKRAVPALIKAAQGDKDSAVRKEAILALGSIGDPKAIEALVGLLGKEDVDILGNHRHYSAVPGLIEASRSENPKVRKEAVRFLGSLESDSKVFCHPESFKPGETVPVLIERLSDEVAEVKKAAINALKRMEEKRAIKPLIGVLEDEDSRVRAAAAEALGKIGGEDATIPLIKKLDFYDEHEDVREKAIDALGQIGDPRAVEKLIGSLDNRFIPHLEESAIARALKRIGGEKALVALIRLMDSGNIYLFPHKKKDIIDINPDTLSHNTLKILRAAAAKLNNKGVELDSHAERKLRALRKCYLEHSKILGKRAGRSIERKKMHKPSIPRPNKANRVQRLQRVQL